MRKRSVVLAIVVSAGLISGALHSALTVRATQAPIDSSLPRLLTPVPEGTASRSLPGGDPAVVRLRPVLVEINALEPTAGPTSGRRVILDLFEDATFVATLNLSDAASAGETVWTGRTDVDPSSQVIIAVRNGVVAGNVRTGSASYQIRYLGGGIHAVQEIDPRAYPHELPPLIPDPAEQTGARDLHPFVDDGSTIDVMVVYTPAARAAAGGTAGMSAQIDLMLAETNVSYGNSLVAPLLRLVHREEIAYTESGDLSTDLSALTEQGDGIMDGVHAVRDAFGADLVSLIVQAGQACGVGWLLENPTPQMSAYAFSVVLRSCATGNYSFGHELGHNMGAHHDRASEPGAIPGAYNYGFLAPSGSWRTIMAYGTHCGNCPRVPYWSNPAIMLGGEPMGVAGGQPNGADNHRTLNEAALGTANFRASGGLPPTQTPTVLAPTATLTPTSSSVPPTTETPAPTLGPGTPSLTPEAVPSAAASPTPTVSSATQTSAPPASPTAPLLPPASCGGPGIESGPRLPPPENARDLGSLGGPPRGGDSIAPRFRVGTRSSAPGAAAPTLPEGAGWTTIACEGWEGAPAAGWSTLDANAELAGNTCWGSTAFQTRFGSRSAWAAAGCEDGVDPSQSPYPNQLDSWLLFGPFSLSGATDARVRFSLWHQMEPGADFLFWGASIDGVTFWGTGTTGNSTGVEPPTSQGWLDVTLNLTDVPELGSLLGQPEVWIGWTFQTDASGTDNGPFIDDVLIQMRQPPTSTPALTPVPSATATMAPSPSPAPSATATAAPSASATSTVPGAAPLGGKNVGIRPGPDSATILWDAGSGQNGYLVLRLRDGNATFVPPGPLAATATSVMDGPLPTGAVPCYLAAPTTGDPPAPASISNLVCAVVNSRSASGAPRDLTLRATESGTAVLSWNSPFEPYDSYLLLPFNGPPQPLSGEVRGASIPISALTCFWLITLRGGEPIGYSDVVCGAPLVPSPGLVGAPSGAPTMPAPTRTIAATDPSTRPALKPQ